MPETPPSPGGPSVVALLFSGGLDTTLEAVHLLEQVPVVHLVTFDNGRCINRAGARRRARELQARYGSDRFVHVELDTSALMQDLLQKVRADAPDQRSPLVVDLACKMAAVCHVVAYARNHGIPAVSDGSAIEQTQVFMQHPEFAAHIKPRLETLDVRVLPPQRFNLRRQEKIAELEKLGLTSGPRSLERLHITSQIAHQPFCLRGFVTFFFTSPTRHFPPFRDLGLPMPPAQALWDLLWPAGEAWILRESPGA